MALDTNHTYCQYVKDEVDFAWFAFHLFIFSQKFLYILCTVHHCDNVPSIPNGKADKKSVRFAHNVTYSCSDGFSLVGNPTPSCQANGKLTSAPFCDASECVLCACTL